MSATDGFTLLRETLDLIAHHTTPETRLPRLLEFARGFTGAEAAWIALFEPAPVYFTQNISEEALSPAEEIYDFAQTLTQDYVVSTSLPDTLQNFQAVLYAPIRYKQRVIALVGLLFTQPPHLSEDHEALLDALIDGLTIVTIETRTIERHQQLMRNQSEFVRITTHDLRSPLTVLKGIIGMMELGTIDLSKVIPNYVEKMASAVHQMEMQVDNIQDAGRYDLETGFYELMRGPTDLIELAQKIVNNQLQPAEKQAIKITVEASDDVPIVNVDSNMLERAIINLVDNAIKYTPDGGEIKVRVYRENDNVVISVKDNGFGISAENLPNLFKRYYRVRRREHHRVKGTGLGLFIVSSAAQQHGGQARVESVEGEGATFYIEIPLSGANLLNATVDV
jgi:signal transduction histidine kinase